MTRFRVEKRRMAGKGRSKAFESYRNWVLSRLSQLLSGEPLFWEEFERRRSRLQEATGPPAARLDWEKPFLAGPSAAASPDDRERETAYGVSRYRLRAYRRSGLIPTATSGPGEEEPGPRRAKRLQWLLFLHHELGIPVPCISAVLALAGGDDLLDALAASVPPHVPIHRSRPPASPAPGNDVDSSLETSTPRVRRMRDLLHEMGNKVHVIAGRAERLRRKSPENELVCRNASIILDQAEQAARSLAEIRALILNGPTTSPEPEKGA